MKAAAIYARYSSDLQNEHSIEDQVTSCRHLLKPGELVTATLSDRGISGAFMGNRPGVLQLIDLIEAEEISVVITEGLDRLSRSQEEIARIFALADYHGVEIRTVIEGSINDLHVGMTGTMSALELKKIAERTRRGQRGAVLAGKVPGGLPYGYAVHPFNAHGEVEPGFRRIVPAQAEVIRAIYQDYLDGRHITGIVNDLNRKGIASPRGGLWGFATIAGHMGRGNGVLQNPIYAGRLIWNRHNFTKHPKTGRRTIRPNDPNHWIVREVPALQIVETDVWEAAQARRAAEHRTRPATRVASARLGFSASCGGCGARLIAHDDKYLLCEGRKKTGLCRSGRKINVRRLYTALFDEILQATAPAKWRRWERLAATQRKRAAGELRKIEASIAAARCKAQCYLEAIGNGLGTSRLVNEALLDREREIARLERRRDELAPLADARLVARDDLAKRLKAARADEARRQLVDEMVDSVTLTATEEKTIEIRDLKPKVGGG